MRNTGVMTFGENSTRHTDDSLAAPKLSQPNALVLMGCQMLVSRASYSEKKGLLASIPGSPVKASLGNSKLTEKYFNTENPISGFV